MVIRILSTSGYRKDPCPSLRSLVSECPTPAFVSLRRRIFSFTYVVRSPFLFASKIFPRKMSFVLHLKSVNEESESLYFTLVTETLFPAFNSLLLLYH